MLTIVTPQYSYFLENAIKTNYLLTKEKHFFINTNFWYCFTSISYRGENTFLNVNGESKSEVEARRKFLPKDYSFTIKEVSYRNEFIKTRD